MLITSIWNSQARLRNPLRGAIFAILASLAPCAVAQHYPPLITAGADHILKKWSEQGIYAGAIGAHTSPIVALALVPNTQGERLVAVDKSGQMRIWRVPSATLLLSQEAHQGAATSLAITPDGKMCVTSGTDKHVRVWNLANGKRLFDLAQSEAHTLHLSPDGKTLLALNASNALKAWRFESYEKERVRLTPLPAPFTNLISASAFAFAPDLLTFALGVPENSVSVGKWNHSASRTTWEVSEWTVRALAFSPDSRFVAAGDKKGYLRVWEVASQKPLPFVLHTGSAINTVLFSVDGKGLITSGADGTLSYWNALNGKRTFAPQKAHTGEVSAMLALPAKRKGK